MKGNKKEHSLTICANKLHAKMQGLHSLGYINIQFLSLYLSVSLLTIFLEKLMISEKI